MEYEPGRVEHDANAREARRRLDDASRIVGTGPKRRRFERLRHYLARLRGAGPLRATVDGTPAQQNSRRRL